MCMHEILPPTRIAQLLAIGKNLLVCMSCMSQWQWLRKLSSASASSFARNLGTYDKKPMIWFIWLLRIRQLAICKLWSGLKWFIEGWTSVENDEYSGKPCTNRSQLMIGKMHSVMLVKQRLTIRQLSKELGLSIGSGESIMTEDLGMKCISIKFVPKLLTVEQKKTRLAVARDLL